MARSQVDELRVRCRFGVKEEGDGWVADEAGCPAQLPLDGAAAHEAACGFATTPCPFAGCGVALRRSESDAYDAAFAAAHARGERAARVACEARLVAVEASAVVMSRDIGRRLLPQAAWPRWRLACHCSSSACPLLMLPLLSRRRCQQVGRWSPQYKHVLARFGTRSRTRSRTTSSGAAPSAPTMA